MASWIPTAEKKSRPGWEGAPNQQFVLKSSDSDSIRKRRSQLSSGGDAAADANTAEQREHLEQSRAYRFSRHRDTRGVYQRSRFHTSRIRHHTQRGFDRDRVERRKLGTGGIERSQSIGHSA